MDKKRILIISFSDLKRDPRVRRQFGYFAGQYAITAVGLCDPEIEGVEFLPAVYGTGGIGVLKKALLLKLCRFDRYYRDKYASLAGLKELLARRSFDLVIANDIDALPFALEAAPQAKVLLDCHEYSPREMEDLFIWRFLYMRYKEYLCETYMRFSHRVTTVCDGIADEYARNFGIRPEVITNASDYIEISPAPVSADAIRLIHHGGALPSRRIELMIEMMAYLDERFSLTMMLVPNDRAYLNRLMKLAAGNPRVLFRDPVPLEEIVPVINGYDVGVYILEPNSFNNEHALPNKFFEFIQARLAVAIGPSPEMARIVRERDCGIVAGDFTPQGLAGCLKTLTRERIGYYKNQADRAAFELSTAGNRKRMLAMAADMLGEDVMGNSEQCAE